MNNPPFYYSQRWIILFLFGLLSFSSPTFGDTPLEGTPTPANLPAEGA